MTPSTDSISSPVKPAIAIAPRSGPGAHASPKTPWWRLAMTAILVVGYYGCRESLISSMSLQWATLTGGTLSRHLAAALLVGTVVAALVALWWRTLGRDKRFHAPLLVTSILLLGDAGFSILENHSSAWLTQLTGGVITQFSPTFVSILAAVITEVVLGRFFYGKWPHLASAYVSGISAGILIHSPEVWPFVMCAMLSITSKYVLRIGDRHLWNPTNLGVTTMLFLAPQTVASLTVQAGNEIWAPVVIWMLGGMILYQLGRLYVPVAFVLTFLLLSPLRAAMTGYPLLAELAPMTSPMFQLYIFFMITDPKTSTKTPRRQILVAVLVGVMETFLRVAFRDVHSLYHALFTVGPLSNLVEIVYMRYASRQAPAPSLLSEAEKGEKNRLGAVASSPV